MITPRDILPFEIVDRFKKYPIGIEVDSTVLSQRIYADYDFNSVNSNTEVITLYADPESPYHNLRGNKEAEYAITALMPINGVTCKICILPQDRLSYVFTEDTSAARAVLTQLKLTYG